MSQVVLITGASTGIARDAGLGSGAEFVGEAVADAVEARAPNLRWPVGRDAARNFRGRAEISDDDWVALHAEPDAERFL